MGEEGLPSRPGYGRAGRPISLTTNHFAMETDLMDVYHYDVEISILYEVRNDDETRPHEAVAPKRLNRCRLRQPPNLKAASPRLPKAAAQALHPLWIS